MLSLGFGFCYRWRRLQGQLHQFFSGCILLHFACIPSAIFFTGADMQLSPLVNVSPASSSDAKHLRRLR